MNRKTVLCFLLLMIALPFFGKETQCMVILNNGSEYRGKLTDINGRRFIFDFPDGRKEFDESEIYMLSFAKERKYRNVSDISQIDDDEILQSVKKAAAYKTQQNESMFILLDKTNYSYDGTNIICTQKKIIKILNEVGKENSVQMVDYNTKNGEICDLIYAITIAADGKVFSLQDDALNNEPLVQDGLYQGERRIKFSMPNPEIGSVFVYEWTKEFPADSLFAPINKRFYLRGDYNIANQELSFTNIPYPLEIYREKGEVKGAKAQITKDKNNITVKAQNIKRITISEPYLPDRSVLLPNIRISSAFDESSVVNYFRPQKPNLSAFDKFVNENGFDNLKTQDDLKRVYAYFQDKIVQRGYQPITQAYKISDIDKMLHERKLSPLDKTALFADVLLANGIESNFVFYSAQKTAAAKLQNGKNIALYPNVALLVRLADSDSRIMLSFEDKWLEFGKLPKKSSFASAMIVGKDSIEYTLLPDTQPEDNKVAINMTGTLNEDGTLLLDRNFILNGNASGVYRTLRFMSDEEKNKFFREIVTSIKIGSVSKEWKINSDLEDKNVPVNFSDSLLIPNYSVVSGDIYLFSLPHFSFDLCDLTSNSRDYTVNWQEKGIKECSYAIKLPESLKVKYMPESQDFSFGNESFHITYQCDDDNVLKVAYSSKSNTSFVKLGDYKKLQAYLKRRMELSKQYIILEKVK